ncbi:hypothetical protein B0O40_1794 [Ruminococcaceae bacterium R-25]|nr:hypothetical protein B0O40_1794 [Ruminococcaceae bacterium R-25]SUQ21658.1 hypothetical protein SAMN06297423_1794 [Oscillospiraceae bacterium]
MRTKVAVCTLIAAMMLAFSGCGEKGMDGRWIKTQIIEKDGTVITGKDIGPAEIYMIEGDRARYSTSLDVNGKDISMELAVVDNQDGTYDFRLIVNDKPSERLALLEGVKFEGNKMTANVNDEYTLVFERD